MFPEEIAMEKKPSTCGMCMGMGYVKPSTMARCPGCGYTVSGGSAYCPSCGMQMATMNESDTRGPCPECGGTGRVSRSRD